MTLKENNTPRSIWQQQRHLEKHQFPSKYQPSLRQRQLLLWLTFEKSTWNQEWHPNSSTQRPSPQQNHQSPSRLTKAQPFGNEKINKQPPRLAWIHQHAPPTAPIADHSQIIIQRCCHRWPITRMWYPTMQARVVSITNQLILKQPRKVSNVQQKQQWTKNTTLWHTRYGINTRTTHTIYLNFLSTTGQKILEHLQDHSINSSFPQFKHKAPMINSVKGHTEINLDERKLSTPV